MKKKILTIAILICFVGINACDDKNVTPTEMKKTQLQGGETGNQLIGTKWELVKLLNTDKNIERKVFIGDDIETDFIPFIQFENDTFALIRTNKHSEYSWGIVLLPDNKISVKPDLLGISGCVLDLYCRDAIFICEKYSYNDSTFIMHHPLDGFYRKNVYTGEITWMTDKDSNDYNQLIFKKVEYEKSE